MDRDELIRRLLEMENGEVVILLTTRDGGLAQAPVSKAEKVAYDHVHPTRIALVGEVE